MTGNEFRFLTQSARLVFGMVGAMRYRYRFKFIVFFINTKFRYLQNLDGISYARTGYLIIALKCDSVRGLGAHNSS